MVANLFDNDNNKNNPQVSSTHRPQRIVVLGTGAVGGYYGARLWQAGHDVRFYLRSLPQSSTSGLRIESIDGDVENGTGGRRNQWYPARLPDRVV